MSDTLNETQTIEKLQATIKRQGRTIDDLQSELKTYAHLRENGFVPDVNEPFFILLARDPFAPAIIQVWAFLRMGRFEEAKDAILSLLKPTLHFAPQSSSDPQIRKAFTISTDMESAFNQVIANRKKVV